MTLLRVCAQPPATGTGDADEFQLPMPGLYADLELGAASLRLPDEFLAQPGLTQLRVLGEWQRGLLRYRRAALERLQAELVQHTPELGEHERRALMQHTCKSLHIEWPEDPGGHGKPA